MEKKKGKQRVVEIELNLEIEEFKRSKLLEKYTVRILFEQNNNKFKNKYLKKLERDIFLFFIFFDLIFLLFFFDNEEVHDCSYMTCHMI